MSGEIFNFLSTSIDWKYLFTNHFEFSNSSCPASSGCRARLDNPSGWNWCDNFLNLRRISASDAAKSTPRRSYRLSLATITKLFTDGGGNKFSIEFFDLGLTAVQQPLLYDVKNCSIRNKDVQNFVINRLSNIPIGGVIRIIINLTLED